MKKKCIIVDIDGTLADVEHRRHFVAGNKPHWKRFFDAMVDDPVIEEVKDIVNRYVGHYTIILCSGRPSDYEEQTTTWLKDNAIYYDRLYMRTAGDYRSDVIVKREMLNEIRKEFDIFFVLDDRQEVVDMWREEGLRCLQVAPGILRNKELSEPILRLNRKRIPNLYIMVGPSGAGKSTFLNPDNIGNRWDKKTQEYHIGPITSDMVISSDVIRAQLSEKGDFRDQENNEHVFRAMHAIAKTRLNHGLDTILDATHIRTKDRKAAAQLGIECVARVFYIVVNRPLEEKLKTGGWRLEVDIKGKNLIEQHDNIFKSNLKDIMKGDGIKGVVVKVVDNE